MDPVEILDILGNENRRRILQLLSFRPFYFNEMAKRLDLGPKAVIDHLEMLERAGLVECYRDDRRRRKYFRIADNVVLEVAFSPHSYGIRTYRPQVSQKIASHPSSGAPSQSSSDQEPGRSEELEEICSRLRDLEEKRLQLRRLMEKIDSEEMLIKRLATSLIESCASDQLEAEILTVLLSGESRAEPLARRLGIPPAVVEERLGKLKAQGKVQKRNDAWTI